MDRLLSKDFTTSRGIKYHYYCTPAHGDKQTVIFLHGFPSTSHDWRHIVPSFSKAGYGVIVPDMLGYGGTDKPVDVHEYKPSLVCRDIIDLLDSEGVKTGICIGHDWGSVTTGQLANLYPDRFSAFAFLAVGYSPPNPKFDAHDAREMMKNLMGYDVLGYWFFFAEPGSDKIVENHMPSFQSLLYPLDPASWKTDLLPLGAAKAYLLADRKTQLPAYITEEEAKEHSSVLLAGGLAAPVCYYKLLVDGITADDVKSFPPERSLIEKPVFLGAALKDHCCPAAIQKMSVEKACTGPKEMKDYDGDHWIILSHGQQISQDLQAWIDSVSVSSQSRL